MTVRSELWRCPACGRPFANPRQTHSCHALRYTLADHFNGKDPIARELFDELRGVFAANGPVRVLPEKTRIAFQVRMSFAAVQVRKRWLTGHLVLARRTPSRHFIRIETFSPRNHLHAFRLDSLDQLDSEFHRLAAAAYAVGCQAHLDPPRTTRRA